MKKKLLTIFVCTILCFTACNSQQSNNNQNKQGSSAESFSSKMLTKLILEDSEIPVEHKRSTIRIKDARYDTENNQYIVMIRSEYDLDDDIWCVIYDGEQILEKKRIEDVKGAIKSCEVVELSQGTYVEFFFASHAGIGSTVLWNPATQKVEYTFEGETVDYNREDYVGEKIVKKYNLPKVGEYEGYGYSFVYQGDKLTSCYTDVDGDGNDDTVFYGVRNLIADEDGMRIAMFSVKKVYLYDEVKNKFVYNKKLSEEKEMK